MAAQYGRDLELLEKIKSRFFNVLSAIYGHVYFPTYSNDLKSIATFLGFNWSDPNASGLQSILWRQQWEQSKDKAWKEKIVIYNREDCNALRMQNTSQIHPEKPLDIFKKINFIFPELERINSCAYFDYQRSKVYCRTNPRVNKTIKRNIPVEIQKLKINKIVWIDKKIPCPRCKSRKTRSQGRHSRVVYDLKIFNEGIKRWITQYKWLRYYCKKYQLIYTLNSQLIPPNLTVNKWNRYGKTLMAWAVNQNIARANHMA